MTLHQYAYRMRPAAALKWGFYLLTGVLCLFASTTLAQQSAYRIPLQLSDSTHTDTLYIGTHPEATDQYDVGLDSPVSSESSDSSFSSFLLVEESTNLVTDFRDTTNSPKSFLIHYQRSEDNDPLILRWDADKLAGKGYFLLSRRSPDGHQLLGIMMNERDRINLSESALIPKSDHFRVNVYPDPELINLSNSSLLPDTSLYRDSPPLQFALDSLSATIDNSSITITTTTFDSSVVVDRIERDTLILYPRSAGRTSVSITASDRQGRFIRDTTMLSVYPSLTVDSSYQDRNIAIHPGETHTLRSPSDYFQGGSPNISYTVTATSEALAINKIDSTYQLLAQAVDTVQLKIRAKDSLGDTVASEIDVHIHPKNNPPPASSLEYPSSDSLVHLKGEPEDRWPIKWKAVSDTDSQPVQYRWKFTVDHNTKNGNTFLSPLYTDTVGASFSYGFLDSLLAERNVSPGDTVRIYHRIETTDGIDTTEGPLQHFTLVRGKVVPYVDVQFIHNAPRLDTVNIFVNQRKKMIADSLPPSDATSFLEWPSGSEIEVDVEKVGNNQSRNFSQTLQLSDNSTYQLFLNGTRWSDAVLHLVSDRITDIEKDDRIAVNAHHGLPDILSDTEFKLKRASNSRLLGILGSDLQYGESSSYMDISTDQIMFQSADHPRQFTFDLGDFDGEPLTFVTTPSRDTSSDPQGLVRYSVSVYDTSGQRHTPLKTKPIGPDEQEQPQPEEIKLFSNYPNPFNPSTEIRFALPQPMHATLKIFNILGKEVETLVNKKLDEGRHSYQFQAKDLTSGIYIYRLQTPQTTKTRKMMLVR